MYDLCETCLLILVRCLGWDKNGANKAHSNLALVFDMQSNKWCHSVRGLVMFSVDVYVDVD